MLQRFTSLLVLATPLLLGNGYLVPDYATRNQAETVYVPGLAFLPPPTTDLPGPDDDEAEVTMTFELFDSLVRPVPGRINSTFGLRKNPVTRRKRNHNGVDMHACRGEPVVAALSGRIVRAKRSRGYGKAIYISHGDGIETRYAHLDVIDVEPGQIVQAGEVIGQVGSTGRATGPHLHFEVRVDGDAIDPATVVEAFNKPAKLAQAPMATPFLWRAAPAP